MREIIIGILTGIVSGIISSVIVTQGYRLKDRERDRIQYIEKFRQFYTQLNRSEERRVVKECRSRWSP